MTGGEKLREEGLTGTGVSIGVIDDGIDEDHPGFDGKVEQRWLRSDQVTLRHGTHVAGTIHMMAPDADIYDYRALVGRNGTGTFNDIANAITKAADDGCDIINMSLGGPSATVAVQDAVKYAYNKGVIIVCASGNGGDGNPLTNEVSFPASYTESLSIAAIQKKEGLPVADFSNSNPEVDYAGIGVRVRSFEARSKGYVEFSGTSMACPHVCGLIAALMTKGGEYENVIKDDKSCRELLNEKFVIDIFTKGQDNSTGLGFATYLTKEEFEDRFYNLPDFVAPPPPEEDNGGICGNCCEIM